MAGTRVIVEAPKKAKVISGCISLLIILLGNSIVTDAQTVRTDRYTRVRVGPALGQIEPLQEITRIVFGDQITTVGQAIAEVLDGTGYRLRHIKDVYEQPVDAILMAQPLPDLHRQLGPMTVKDALDVLAGDAWHMKENALGRECWFVLNPHYAKDQTLVQRLLRESSQHSIDAAAQTVEVRFPPGNTNAPHHRQALEDAIARIDHTTLTRIDVLGQSYSRSTNGSAALAK